MIKKLIQEAFILKSKKYYKHSIEIFYKALELDNSSLELLLEIADVYFLMGEIERSINYIEQILEKDPVHVSALKLLKKIFINNDAYEEAIETAKNIYQITSLDVDYAEILRLLNLGAFYEDVINSKENSSHPLVLYEIAFAKFMIKNYDSALIDIENCLNIDEHNNLALLLKGKILYKLNRKKECLIYLNIFKNNDENAEIIAFKGLIYQYMGEYKKAIDHFKKAIRLLPKFDEFYYNCASTYFKMGEIQAAKKYYNMAISLNPQNQTYHFALANLYYSEKQYKRALEELGFDFFEARLLKSIILYDSGFLAIAKKEFDKLYNENPENHIIKEYMSKIKEELSFN